MEGVGCLGHVEKILWLFEPGREFFFPMKALEIGYPFVMDYIQSSRHDINVSGCRILQVS